MPVTLQQACMGESIRMRSILAIRRDRS